MTRPIALVIWAATAGLLAGCELLSLATRRRFAGLLALTSRLSSTPGRRLLLALGWMWLGWHLFAR